MTKGRQFSISQSDHSEDLVDTLCSAWSIHSISHKTTGVLPFEFDSQENPFREMVLFHRQVAKVEQSCFGSEDLTETLTSAFEIIAERT